MISSKNYDFDPPPSETVNMFISKIAKATVMQFRLAAMGGTFDVIHAGHMALLDAAFSASSSVIIGLSSDALAKKRGKDIWHTYPQRLDALKSVIEKKFPGRSYTISQLDDDFGPAVLESEVDALVASEETAHQGEKLNLMREKKGMPPVLVVVVPMVMASDGSRISSTRIRRSEIDQSGKLL